MSPILAIDIQVGHIVRLEHLNATHSKGIAQASAQDRSSFGFTRVPQGEDAARIYVTDMLAAQDRGELIAFAQCRISDETVIGVTTYLNLRRRPDNGALFAVEIGHTWLAGTAQRSGINVEAKLLLLTHAFTKWEVARVDIKTDARNENSRRAIEALGATYEGTLRQWQPSQVVGEENGYRDTAMYSVVAGDWPVVKATLEAHLNAPRSSS